MTTETSLTQRIRDGSLLDAYGGLLTEKQRMACEAVLLQDLSLAEAADLLGVTRQGIHDLVTRAKERMEETEQRLGLLKKENAREEMAELLEEYRAALPEVFYNKLAKLLEV